VRRRHQSLCLCQRPLTRSLTVPILPLAWQSRGQQHQSRWRLRARCRPQGDDDHQPKVRRLRVFAFVMSAPIDTLASFSLSPLLPSPAAQKCLLPCQRPLTLLLSHGSLACNELCGLDYQGCGIYTTEGINKLCEALKGSAVTALKCASAPQCPPLCQCPLTRLLSHLIRSAPHSQSGEQPYRRRGRLRARCCPHGDEDHHALVRRHP
jgi:hypothetical protein